MNFNFTPLKTIISIIVGFLVDFVLSFFYMARIDCTSAPLGVSGSCLPPISHIMLKPLQLIPGLIMIIILYIIWSLIQKKK